VSVCEELVEDIHQGESIYGVITALDDAIAWGRKAFWGQVFTSLRQSSTFTFESNNLYLI